MCMRRNTNNPYEKPGINNIKHNIIMQIMIMK